MSKFRITYPVQPDRDDTEHDLIMTPPLTTIDSHVSTHNSFDRSNASTVLYNNVDYL